MRVGSSTFRSAADQTIGSPSTGADSRALEQLITSEWQRADEPDLVGVIRRHPQVLEKRSLLLNLAINEFRARRAIEGEVDLEPHCGRFRQFGSSIERSILRQLETQQYIDDHPDLLGLLSEPKWPAIGESFLNFHILEELGRGGAARVYLCREPDVGNRLIVLKVTPFCDFEASVLGRLNHPNIIPIFSTGIADDRGLQYLCMPYRGRSTLADLIDVAFQAGVPADDSVLFAAAARWLPAHEAAVMESGAWSAGRFREKTFVGRVLSIGVKLADALDHAHRQGILHGDLKPSNVLLTSDGTVLLLDFNLSQDAQAILAVCGGTLSYMPPEHLRYVAQPRSSQFGRPAFDARSDVYSFGALLYELLAGRAPVTLCREAEDQSTAAAVLLQQLREGVAPLRSYNRMVSARLESFVMRCLALELDERPASIAEVRESLARELRAAPSIGRQVRRRPVLFASLLSASLGLATVTGVYVANRPPRYLAYYHEGVEHAQSGQPAEAVEHFSASLALNPGFSDAQFQRAVARVKLGEIGSAMSEFRQLAQTQDDSASMAYLGYCYNLKQIPTAAIEWYEKAVENGAESAAVYNNLGASYLVALGGLSNQDRYVRAEECLSKAFQLLGSSDIVSLNIIRLERAKSAADPRHNPAYAWNHADALLKAAPDDPFVKNLVGKWYATVVTRAADLPHTAPLQDEKLAQHQFQKLITYAPAVDSPGRTGSRAAFPRAFVVSKADSSAKRFYIEPVVANFTTARTFRD